MAEYFKDEFTGAAATEITAHAPDIGSAWIPFDASGIWGNNESVQLPKLDGAGHLRLAPSVDLCQVTPDQVIPDSKFITIYLKFDDMSEAAEGANNIFYIGNKTDTDNSDDELLYSGEIIFFQHEKDGAENKIRCGYENYQEGVYEASPSEPTSQAFSDNDDPVDVFLVIEITPTNVIISFDGDELVNFTRAVGVLTPTAAAGNTYIAFGRNGSGEEDGGLQLDQLLIADFAPAPPDPPDPEPEPPPPTGVITIDGISLNRDMVWLERYHQQQVSMSTRRTLAGGVVVFSGALDKGIKITLEAQQNLGWLRTPIVNQLIALAADPIAVHELNYNGVLYQVMFDHSGGPAVEMNPTTTRISTNATDWFRGQIHLITV